MWIFNLDFCTPKYVIMRKLIIDKLGGVEFKSKKV